MTLIVSNLRMCRRITKQINETISNIYQSWPAQIKLLILVSPNCSNTQLFIGEYFSIMSFIGAFPCKLDIIWMSYGTIKAYDQCCYFYYCITLVIQIYTSLQSNYIAKAIFTFCFWINFRKQEPEVICQNVQFSET